MVSPVRDMVDNYRSPADIRRAFIRLRADVAETGEAVAASDVDPRVRAVWLDFVVAFEEWADSITSASDLWGSTLDEIQRWRARLVSQRNALARHGVSTPAQGTEKITARPTAPTSKGGYVSPGMWRGALAQVTDEFVVTQGRVTQAEDIDPVLRGQWLSFLQSFTAWLNGLDATDSMWGSSYDEIEQWQARLVQWRARLTAAGVPMDAADVAALPEGASLNPLDAITSDTADALQSVALVLGVVALSAGGLILAAKKL